ncbi:MAG: mechanosensitive ion channel family protein [Chloroflexi bacterium]|nr:mechanosensitive ion channel family protein [Chloroflexota bacterium]
MEQILGETTLTQGITAVAIFVASIGLALLLRLILGKVAKRLLAKIGTGLDNALITALSKPLIGITIIIGLYVSVLLLRLEPAISFQLLRRLAALIGLLGIFAGASLVYVLANWYEKEVIAERETGLTSRLTDLLRILIVLLATFLGVLLILSNLGAETTAVTGWIGEHGWRVILIIIIALVAILAMGGVIPKLMVATVSRRPEELEEEVNKRTQTLSRVLVNAAQVAIIVSAFFMVLSELNINIAPVLAGVGVAGIAIGFGAQSLVKDLVAGLFIIMESQYRVGDVVRIADIAGLVEDINLRRTVLRDLDGIVHIVPNGEIRVASNFTKEWSRVNMNVSVAYGEDLDRVMAVINRVGKELAEDPTWAPLIMTPPRALRVDKLGDSGIEIKILGETKPIRQWDVMGELRLRLKKAFDKEGIEIPWPHTKVYFGNSPSETSQEPGEKASGQTPHHSH